MLWWRVTDLGMWNDKGMGGLMYRDLGGDIRQNEVLSSHDSHANHVKGREGAIG